MQRMNSVKKMEGLIKESRDRIEKGRVEMKRWERGRKGRERDKGRDIPHF